MPVSTGVSSPPKSGSFASLLAGFAATPARPARERGSDGLEDDVATISYEQALRTHARRRPAAALGLPFEPNALPADEPSEPEAAAPAPAALPQQKPAAAVRISAWTPETKNPALEASRKASSITIRLTRAECDQVHERAAAAGLTASAYLRSCLFEAETLRAQVKEALDQFRAAGPASGPAEGKKPVRSEGHAADAAQSPRRSWLRSRWLGGESAKSA